MPRSASFVLLFLAASRALGLGLPEVPGRSWMVSNAPWQVTPFGSQLYVYGEEVGSSTTLPPTIQVFDGLNGTVIDSFSVPTGSKSGEVFFNDACIVAENGDVILRDKEASQFSFTSTALRRYSIAKKQVVWEVPVESTATGTVGVLAGDYVYTTLGAQLRVVSATNGTVVASFTVAPVNPTSDVFIFSSPLVAQPKGTPGWLIVDQGSAVQGYSLANPARPTLVWNATDMLTGATLNFPEFPRVSLDGRWLIGLISTVGPTTLTVTMVTVVDTSTGAARSHLPDHVPTIWGASGTLAMLSTSRQHGTVMSTTYGAFNLTSMEFAQPTRPHFVGGAVQCGLATDGSVFVCATKAFSTDSTSTAETGVGFTVFDATTTGAVVAQYEPSNYNFEYPPQLDDGGEPLLVVPSTDGNWYNAYLSTGSLAMVQLPRA